MRFEGGRYYVVAGNRFGEGGALNGQVVELGWSDRYIVGKRLAMHSDVRSGWMIIDAQKDEIRGPFTDAEFEEAARQDRDLAAIRVLPVTEAWAQ